ncbi:MAG: glycosyltransferase family 2 protein [Candidatus Aminicenantes bacterium]|nr:glycosyltransferase family 2 protein [Candidatus Aminicenantes bacterium]
MKATNDLVYFIVVNFNASSIIEECLNSILSQDYKTFKILIVDNKSTDRSVDLIRKRYPNLKLITLDKNYGFARANNIAVNRIRKENPGFFVFINTDVIIDSRWLSSCVRFLTDNQYEFAQSIITNYESMETIDSLGIGISRHLKIYDRKSGQSLSAKNNDKTIFGPCFAAAIFKREVIELLSGEHKFLNEEFNTFYEDVDCCFRANYNGFKAGLLSIPLSKHRRSFTADRQPFRKYFFIGRNYFLILGKHIPLGIFLKNLVWIILDRFVFLLNSIKQPSFFFGFLIGSFFGILKIINKILLSERHAQGKMRYKTEVLDKIKRGFYA